MKIFVILDFFFPYGHNYFHTQIQNILCYELKFNR